MQDVMRAYVAGCIDCDGSITVISRSDGKRFEPAVLLNQVTPQIPRLLLNLYGGNMQHVESKPPRKDRYMWRATNSIAIDVCKSIKPYLTTKVKQATLLLKLWELNHNPRMRTFAYWYEKDNPNWEDSELVNTKQAQELLGYKHPESVKQAIYNDVLLALPGKSGTLTPRIPLDQIKELRKIRDRSGISVRNGGMRLPSLPLQLIELRREIAEEVWVLNKKRC